MSLVLDKLAKTLQDSLDNIKLPDITLPPSLMYCVAIKRTGGSCYRTAAEAWSDLVSIGFEGDDEMTKQLIYAQTKSMYNMLTKQMKFDVVFPPGSIITTVDIPGVGAFPTTNKTFVGGGVASAT